MVAQNGPKYNEEYLRQGQPTNTTYVESVPRWAVDGNLSALTTAVMLSVALPLQFGDKVTNLSFCSGATAADTPANQWVALYDTAGALISQSVDLADDAWAANTVKTFTLASPYTCSTPGIYFAALMVKASTPPTLRGASVGHAAVSSTGIGSAAPLARTSGSSLTDTAPATIATPTVVANVPYVVAT